MDVEKDQTKKEKKMRVNRKLQALVGQALVK